MWENSPVILLYSYNIIGYSIASSNPFLQGMISLTNVTVA